MRIRDGGPDDADAVAALADLPSSVAAQLLRDRTVRVADSAPAEESGTSAACHGDADRGDVGDGDAGDGGAGDGGAGEGAPSGGDGGDGGRVVRESDGATAVGDAPGADSGDGGDHEGPEVEPSAKDRDRPSLAGVVAFDARPGTVHVTQVAGEHEAVAALLEEPLRFARAEGMTVELVLPIDAAEAEAVEAAGFEAVGEGPTFDGGPTRRYRHAGGSG